MRFPRAIPVALAVTAAFVAVPVMARAPSDAHPAQSAQDACAVLHDEADAEESRFSCTQESSGDAWAAWIARPAPGARDLVLTTVHVGPRGTRTTGSDTLSGAAAWFPTIAPITIAPTAESVTVAVVRVGFREYPLASHTFPRS
jgi:hypothetical protein